MSITVCAFYKFVRIDDPAVLRSRLRQVMAARDIKGTILLAPEGINGTISAEPTKMSAFLSELRDDPRFAELVVKQAQTDRHPFQRLKVRLKREIVTLRAPEADPTKRVGTYVAPKDWNALITDPEVIVIDTRNAYEVADGTFKGAIDPGTRSFGQFPQFVARNLDPARHKRVAMFCTGGIRCEKASAYMLAHGFPEVYHLEGGILRYLAEVPEAESLWQGKCFVFDERGGVDGNDDLG
jgi:UPF0176 protein